MRCDLIRGSVLGMSDLPEARRAHQQDVDSLLRLRVRMLADMGVAVSDVEWRAAAREWFTDRLRRPGEFAAFVVDDPEGGVVSCAVGLCEPVPPGPGNHAGLHGRVLNMSTEPAHRRRGYAKSCLQALLDWFQAETPARVINLNATAGGVRMYESMGFRRPDNTALRLRLT
ncbi:MAG: GNAT family N-acetyltransferase [Saccharopolyspora sp.]|uniref:GNAT family N-acetyltransferase n=1 Tax=Saccharopolyspora sp. TaxID=33915 RepID=UPI0025E49953|nr:GNAT family N-acetyltransferase [Saccharopolyspora sp.]MBQ6643743.1 GNAT family N-acetyltransferase [Saccharopolyspora sp.]